MVVSEGVKQIGKEAFVANSELTITLPETIESIGSGAFNWVNTVRVPRSVLDSLSVYEDGFANAYAQGATIEVIE